MHLFACMVVLAVTVQTQLLYVFVMVFLHVHVQSKSEVDVMRTALVALCAAVVRRFQLCLCMRQVVDSHRKQQRPHPKKEPFLWLCFWEDKAGSHMAF